MKKYSGSIAGAVILISATAILSRAIGFLREVIFANTFGLNRDFEIYLVAAVLPILINSAIYYLAQNYFIPLYNKYINAKEKMIFLKNQFWFFFLSGALLSVIFYVFRGVILHLYLGNTEQEVYLSALKIYVIYILSFPVNAGYSVLASYLQSELKFRHPAFSQLFLNIPIIFLVLFFHDSLLIFSIPIGYLAGSILQLAYLLMIVGPGNLSFKLRSSDWDLKNLLKGPLLATIIIEVINQLHPFIDRYFFNQVEPGGIASLNYASVLFALPVTIFSFALASVIFPVLSKYINSDTPEKTGYYYLKSLRIMTIVFIPIALIYFYDGDLIIKIVFHRGSFTESDVNITSEVLKMYSLSLVFYAAYALINKMIFSAGLLKELLILSIILIVSKFVLNGYLVQDMHQDGLALSSSISFVILSVGSYYLVSGKVKTEDRNAFIKDILLLGISAVLTFYISNELIGLTCFVGIWQVLLEIAVFLLLYLFSIRFMNMADWSLLRIK